MVNSNIQDTFLVGVMQFKVSNIMLALLEHIHLVTLSIMIPMFILTNSNHMTMPLFTV